VEEKISIKGYRDIPILSMSLQSTLPNKTGACDICGLPI